MYKITVKKDFFFKLAPFGHSDKRFHLTEVICPWAMYMYEIMKKKLYKVTAQRDFYETSSSWPLLDIKPLITIITHKENGKTFRRDNSVKIVLASLLKSGLL